MLLDLPRDVIRSVARFRLRAHALRIETVTWTNNTSPICAPMHTWSLRWTYASLFSFAGFNNVCFLGQENNKLYFFLHVLKVFFYEQDD